MPRRAPAAPDADARDGTKARLIDAAITTLATEGFANTSARAIARTGDLNPALIFYHFGSVNDLLLAALDRLSAERLQRYREGTAGVRGLAELARVGRQMFEQDAREGKLRMLAELVAGGSSSPEFGREVRRRFDDWIEVLRDALTDSLGGTPAEQLIPVPDLAYAIAALFIGAELLTNLDPEDTGASTLFESLHRFASLFPSPPAAAPPTAPPAAAPSDPPASAPARPAEGQPGATAVRRPG